MSVAYAVPGHNNPPGVLDSGRDTMTAISGWMAEHPVIDSEDAARDAKLLLDRYKASAGEIEDQRIKLVRPLNDRLDEINTAHKAIHNTDSKRPGLLDKIANELKSRLTAFMRAEETRREAVLREAERILAEKERLARAADARQQEAIANANAGELGVDVTQVVVEADNLYGDFERAERDVARAERDTNVRIGGGFSGRVATLRNVETLSVTDAAAAFLAMWPNDKLNEALLTAAREHRKTAGLLPPGITSSTTRKI